MVMYSTEHFKGFTPDDCQEGNECNPAEERVGRFHCWVKEERKSAQSGNFREETVALVEDEITGEMHHVDYNLMRFIKEN